MTQQRLTMVMKPRTWDQRTRTEKHASVLWSGQTDKDTQSEMAAIAKGEKKQAPAKQPLLSDQERGACSPLGGRAK